jgi:hypothetical protein
LFSSQKVRKCLFSILISLGWRCTSVIVHSPAMWKALGPILSTVREKKKDEENHKFNEISL